MTCHIAGSGAGAGVAPGHVIADKEAAAVAAEGRAATAEPSAPEAAGAHELPGSYPSTPHLPFSPEVRVLRGHGPPHGVCQADNQINPPTVN